MFMMTAISVLAAIIVIEAAPLSSWLRARQAGQNPGLTGEIGIALLLVTAVCSLATLIPLRLGLRRLESLEA